MNMFMAGFYTQHNTGIGLQCFAWGLLVVPGMLVTMFNAIHLGAAFGYMARPDVPAGDNFFHFVTAHGPFELTAIVLSAGAGLRLGLSWMMTNGLTRTLGPAQSRPRSDARRRRRDGHVLHGRADRRLSFPLRRCPTALKIGVALISSGLLAVYFIVLGFPSEARTRTENRLTNRLADSLTLDSAEFACNSTAPASRSANEACLETIDLALFVIREFAGPILACAPVGDRAAGADQLCPRRLDGADRLRRRSARLPLPVEHDAADLSRSAAGRRLHRGLSRAGRVSGGANDSPGRRRCAAAGAAAAALPGAPARRAHRLGPVFAHRAARRPTAGSKAFS